MIYKTILCKRKSIKTCLNDGVEISLHKVINSIVAVTKGENIWECKNTFYLIWNGLRNIFLYFYLRVQDYWYYSTQRTPA